MSSSASFEEWLHKEKAKSAERKEQSNSFNWKFWKSNQEERDLEEGTVDSLLGHAQPTLSRYTFPSIIENRSDRYKGFFLLLILSAIFFLLAFVVGIPMILIRPGKFAISFTMGSIMFMLAFAVYDGFSVTFHKLFSKEKMLFTSTYIISMILTLYAAVIKKSYIFTVLMSVVQVTTLVYFGCASFPGGMMMLTVFKTMITKICGGCMSLITK